MVSIRTATAGFFACVVLYVAYQLAFAESQDNKPPKETLKTDYSDELPRIAPRAPAQALQTFKLRPNFRIELVASEPLVRDPVAIEFDENGRLFVVEMPEYNQYENPHRHGLVKLLEDTDDDGRFDKSSVFVDGLDSPAAVACYDGGIFVGAVPDILFCKDTDGDLRADVRRPVFTGFARDHAGEAMLNSFRWGVDNRFHVSTSLAGGDVRPAGDTQVDPVSVRTRGFLFDPRNQQFELTSGGGQHGMSMDDWGTKFVCSNSDPILMLMYDGRYLARNPFMTARQAAVSIAPGGKFTKVFRISTVEPWRKLRTRLRAQGLVRGSDEGGQPTGFFTGATGVTVYRGDAWPSEYRGNVLVGEVASNMIYRARLEPNKTALTARRADPGVEFLASSDNWFRPVQFAHGPDGNLYVVDMYRELIEGAAFLPPQILQHLDAKSGTDHGRIYRIVRTDFKQPQPPRLGKATTSELVALLEHTNGWHRDTASRLLYQRQDRRVIGSLRRLAVESDSPQGRMHALYALQGLEALYSTDVVQALQDPSANLRRHALRLAEPFAAESFEVRTALLDLIEDPDIQVRYQLAFSLGSFPGTPRNQALIRLFLSNGSDSWFRLAVQSSLHQGAEEVFHGLVSRQSVRESDVGKEFLGSLATQIGAANRQHEIASVLKSLNSLADDERPFSQAMIKALVAKQSGDARQQLLQAAGGRAESIFEDLLEQAKTTASDPEAQSDARAQAARTLGMARYSEVRKLFAQLLQVNQPQSVQAAALETLGKFSEPDVADLILAAWRPLSPQLRARAVETLFSRPDTLTRFLDAVEEQRIKRAEIDPARIRLLQAHRNKSIRDRAQRVFASEALPRRQQVVAKYQASLAVKGDTAQGKAVFKKVCSACHRLEGVGTAVGADLKAIRDRGAAAVLLNILDPNREVKPQFLSYVLVTSDGRSITGMIAGESANSITIRRTDGTTETVLRVDIEELQSTQLSFMPEGLEKQIDERAMADLLAYLNSIR